MMKRAIASAIALTLSAGMVLGTDLLSYVTTAGRNLRAAVKSEITPEFELQRIQGEIENLMPEIKQHMTIVAEQRVEMKDMERQIDEKEASLETQRESILALRDDLASDRDSFTYKRVSYTRTEVEADLAHRFDAFRSAEDSVTRDRQILEAQRQTLRANQTKLNTMLERKQALAVQVSQLEARLKTIQATEAINNLEVDDSKLCRVEDMIRELNRSLDVRESLLETEGKCMGRIPVEERNEPETDVLAEIDRHFGVATDTKVAAKDSN